MIGKKKKKGETLEISSSLHSLQKNQLKHSEDDLKSKFIFYGDDKKFSHQLEICAVYQYKKSLKVLVLVDEESTIDFLRLKISEGFETLPEFCKLCGLTATNLHKIRQQGEEIQCPTEGIIQDNFINGDIVYCNLLTQEYWINVIFKLSNKYFTKMMAIDYKISVSQSFKALKLLLLKCGVNFYIERLRANPSFKNFSFMVKNVQFCLNNDLSWINHNDTDLDEERIRKLFNFEGKIKCYIAFELFEEIIFRNIKQNENTLHIQQKLRWSEFEDIDFKELINKNGFIAEKKAIQKLAKEQIPFLENDFYIYSFSQDINYFQDNNLQDDDDNNLDDPISRYKEQVIFFMPFEEENEFNLHARQSPKKLSKFSVKKQSDDNLSYLKQYNNNDNDKPIKNIIKSPNCYSFLESTVMPCSGSPSNEFILFRRNSTHISNIGNEKEFVEETNSLNDSKRFFETVMNRPTHTDFAKELTSLFDHNSFNEELKNNSYKIKLVPRIIESLSIPEFRDFQKMTVKDIKYNDDFDIISQEEPVTNINNLKILVFVILAFLYYISIVVVIYFDFIKII